MDIALKLKDLESNGKPGVQSHEQKVPRRGERLCYISALLSGSKLADGDALIRVMNVCAELVGI